MVRRKAFALGAAVALVFGLAGSAAAQSLDDIVALNYKSKGGDKWKTIQTQKMTGAVAAQGMEMGLTIYSKRPNLGRQEITLAAGGQNVTMVTMFDGQKAWTINPMSGSDAPQEMAGPEADTVRDQSDFDGPLLDYKAKGHTAELVGPSTVAGKKAHHIKITRKDKVVVHYHIDAETGVELKVINEMPGGNVETELGDYKLVDGVNVPHSIKVMQGGMVMAELRIAKIEFNVPVNDALFKVK